MIILTLWVVVPPHIINQRLNLRKPLLQTEIHKVTHIEGLRGKDDCARVVKVVADEIQSTYSKLGLNLMKVGSSHGCYCETQEHRERAITATTSRNVDFPTFGLRYEGDRQVCQAK
jgi:hypothetical protein